MRFWRLPASLIRLLNMTRSIGGRCGKYLFQMSNGSQQVKLYNKKIYRNNNNTPLRIRARTIMRLANEDPVPSFREKMRELYRSYPFYLLKSRKEYLKITNFYFSRYIFEGTEMRIYRQIGPEPDPGIDLIYAEFEYSRKRKILLQYTGDDEERYYVRNMKRDSLSNVLFIYWE